MTPTARSLALLRSQGWVGDVVERWIGGGKFRVRKDFLGFADIVGIQLYSGPYDLKVRAVAVQATSGTNIAHRLAKMRETPGAVEWLRAGGMIEIHGWAKRGARGKRKAWQVRVVVVTEEMLAGDPVKEVPCSGAS